MYIRVMYDGVRKGNHYYDDRKRFLPKRDCNQPEMLYESARIKKKVLKHVFVIFYRISCCCFGKILA